MILTDLKLWSEYDEFFPCYIYLLMRYMLEVALCFYKDLWLAEHQQFMLFHEFILSHYNVKILI